MQPSRIASVLFAFGLILLAGVAAQDNGRFIATYYVPGGFLKGGDFKDLPEGTREGYAMGFVNGLLVAEYLGADDKAVRLLSDCVQPMRSDQVAEIIGKHVRDNPAQWHEGLNGQSLNAIVSACPLVAQRRVQMSEQKTH